MQQDLFSKAYFFKQLCCLFILLLSGFTSNAQVKLLFDNAVYDGDTVRVDLVAVDNFTNVTSFQYTIAFESDLLEFVGTSNYNLDGLNESSFGLSNTSNGALSVSWIDPTLEGITVPNGTALYSISFTRLSGFAGTLQITGDPTPIEFIELVNNEAIELELNTCEFSLRPANLVGSVFHDLNDNCAADADEQQLQGWIIIATNAEGEARYATTNREGNFGLNLAAGTYFVEAIPTSDLWANCAEASTVVVSDIEGEVANVVLGQVSALDCAVMEVSISTPFVRRCFENTYTVAYANNGTVPAEGSYIEVTFDESFSYVSSTLAGTLVAEGSNTYRYDLGNVDINQHGAFKVTLLSGCDDVALGQTQCVMAHIFPDDPCKVVDPLWSGADIQVTGECTEDDEVRFTIMNTGEGSMNAANRFIVSQDMILLQQEDFQLESGESRVVSLAGDGKTYRLKADQAIANPRKGITAAVVEGCGTDANGEISLGFANIFPQSDEDPWISIDCQENRGAYDPNDKTPFPKGYGEKRFIENDVELEYKIRFQNTGTDTAFNIVVLDTLSVHLDASTVRPGASSHPYEFEITDEGIISFMFDNIMLPDSNINEPASHGFVIFKINQTADNVDDTEIYNDAAIYFDFNEPVITNETKHTIGREFVEVVNAVNNVDFPDAVVNVFPNPFVDYTTFAVQGVDNKNVILRVYNLQGQLIRQQESTTSSFNFYKKGLQSGMYLFEMIVDNKVLNQGKLMVK